MLAVSTLLALLGQAEIQALDTPYLRALRQGREALQHGDTAAALRHLEVAARAAPEVPEILADLARAQAAAGHPDRALRTLASIVAFGFGSEIPEDPRLAAVRSLPGYRDLEAKIAEIRRPIASCQIALTLDETDLIPEGIVFDPMRKAFFLGSTYLRKIVSLDFAGHHRNLTAEGQGGIWSVLGLRIDPRNGQLLACSEVDGPNMKGYRQADLVHRHFRKDGYSLRSFTRASSVVNFQLAPMAAWLR